MTETSLLAIIDSPDLQNAPDGVTFVKGGRFTAAFIRQKFVQRLTRKAAAKAALARQTHLETLMHHGTVLPCLPGTPLRPDQTPDALRANAPALEKLSKQLEGQVQFQLSVGFDQEAAGHWLQTRDGAAPIDIASAMQAKLSATAETELDGILSDILGLPLSDGLAFNAAVLVPTNRIEDFEAGVERIDTLWSEGLHIRQIGPSPAVSFASITFRRIKASSLAQSRALLGITASDDGETISKARRAALLMPDADPEAIRAAAELCNFANCAPAQSFPLFQIETWSEGRSAAASQTVRKVA